MQAGEANIEAIAPCWDGSLIATITFPNSIKILDGKFGGILETKLFDNSQAGSVTFSPNGKIVAVGLFNGQIVLLNLVSDTVTRIISSTQYVQTLSFSNDGRLIACGSGSTAAVYSVSDGSKLWSSALGPSYIYSLAFNGAGTLLAVAGNNTSVQLLDARTGVQMKSFTEHHSQVTSIAFVPDGSAVVSADISGEVDVNDVENPLLSYSFSVPAGNVVLSQNGLLAATTGPAKSVQVWDISKEAISHILANVNEPSVMVFAPSGKSLYALTSSGLQAWSTSRGGAGRVIFANTGYVHAVAFSPTSEILAVDGTFSRTNLWDLKTGSFKRSLYRGQDGHICAFSPDGCKLAVGYRDNCAKVWDVATGRQLLGLVGHTGQIHGISWSPDGQMISTGSYDDTARTWNAKTGAPLHRSAVLNANVFTVPFSPDSKSLAVGAYGMNGDFAILNARDLSRRVLLANVGQVYTAAFNPDGNFLAAVSPLTGVQIWNARSGGPAKLAIEIPGGGMGIAYSPDGKMIVVGQFDGTVSLWSATGKPIVKLKGHTAGVKSVAFDESGKIIASGGLDGSVILWSVAKHSEIARLYGFDNSDWLVVSPDGLYDGTTGGLSHVQCVSGLHVISIGPRKNQIVHGLLKKLLEAHS